jgi:YegS/Rv2252/BmrU family lipid kinase
MYHFIVNLRSRAGRAEKVWKTVQAELDAREIEYKAYITKYSGHATKLADMICCEYDGLKNIVMVGSDGTVNEVINGLHPYSEVLLGFIPVGKGNDLARGMGIPSDPVEALNRIIEPKRYQYVDHGVLNFYDGTKPRRFAVSAGMGLDAAVCSAASHSAFKLALNRIGFDKLVYAVIGIKQIFRYKPVDVEILVDGIKKRRIGNMIFAVAMIQKTEGSGHRLAPKADNADGKLTVCLIHDISRFRIALLTPLLLMGKHTKIRGVEVFDCTSLEITAAGKEAVHTDGEIAGRDTHFRFACLPERIRMFV